MVDEARRIDEQNTARRAQILNMQYLDTTTVTNKQLFKEVLTLPELYELKLIPIRVTEQPKQILRRSP